MKPSTQHDYNRRIGRVIAAILDDPAAPHTVESLAAVSHLSPFHFHRIYRALTGEGVAETVQRLRLARAARRLGQADARVIEVALDVGYDSPQAFARAFRGFAGVSPSRFQSRQRDLAEAQNAPSVEIVRLEPTPVACLTHKGPEAMISQTFRRLLAAVDPDQAARGTLRRIGIGYGDPEQPRGFRYLAAVALPAGAGAGAPPGLETTVAPGGLYARHRLVGPYGLIAPTFQILYGGWLPGSGFEPDDRPNLEFYNSAAAATSRRDFVTDLMIPIRET